MRKLGSFLQLSLGLKIVENAWGKLADVLLGSCGSQGFLGRMKAPLAVGLLPLNHLTASLSSFPEIRPSRQKALMVPCGVL